MRMTAEHAHRTSIGFKKGTSANTKWPAVEDRPQLTAALTAPLTPALTPGPTAALTAAPTAGQTVGQAARHRNRRVNQVSGQYRV